MTGIDHIARERQEQIEKHGRTVEMDARDYPNEELLQAAQVLLKEHITIMDFPKTWINSNMTYKMAVKSREERAIIAGALIAAAIDVWIYNKDKIGGL